MGKKMPLWLKVGLIVTAAVLFVEILAANFIFTLHAFPQFLDLIGFLTLITHFPFAWLGSMNDSFVLSLTRNYDAAFYRLNALGVIVVTLFWGLVGVGIGKLYENYLKN